MATVSPMAIDVNEPRHCVDENDVINGGNVIYAGDVMYAAPQAQRHSGAPRSGEPGIYRVCCQAGTAPLQG